MRTQKAATPAMSMDWPYPDTERARRRVRAAPAGAYLLANAYWPSTCKPDTLTKIYSCSFRLADNHGWVETVLMTWLWSTPLLIALEISRRLQKPERR